MKLISCKGLPASGKTTWAKAYVASHRKTIRVNRDDLRQQLHDGKYTTAREKVIVAAQNALIVAALKAGQSVVVDDTNLHESNEPRLRKLGKRFAALLEIREFDVAAEECVRRDATRAKPVGARVIRDYATRYGFK